MTQQVAYTADDGLRVMMFLGLPLNEREQEIFRSEFPRHYGTSDRYDLIGTLWEIYAGILAFKAYPTETIEEQRLATTRHMQRDTEFYARLDRKKLQERLEQGIPLNEIIKG